LSGETSVRNNALWLSWRIRLPASGLLLGSLVLLWWGLALPILHVEKFWIFGQSLSVWSGMNTLFAHGELFLGGVLLVFSIVFPSGKNLLLIVTLLKGAEFGARSRQLLRWSALLGKWSMLDVFIVAILVASVRLGALAEAQVRSALYFFAASVLLTNLTSTALDAWVERRTTRA